MLFLVLSNGFEVLMSKKKKTEKEKIILMYFQAKNTFKKHCTSQYQTHT
jgi:hypothetical protein